ncbi:LOW QUALITY PROTEIN: rRNA biogenesis protein RRP36 [Salvia miltiorrhiza]|uniref:LOW QUALITY PROTEIN: rRNA biogenesis protein RRP36 n=1 Tax=Salvia miltiorrhiza TaxID=226208 RepID=UPI0025ACFCD0|nr:LOW QUALITY PROTEIN: rRNA biogenesis protein RRP36 [Salvia miltiorrhiza]
MIKRRFYRYEHGDKDAASESSSSSSGSEVEAEATDATDIEEEEEEEEEAEEENVASDVREKGEASSSSGYESEDSSVNEVNLDSSGLPTSDEDTDSSNWQRNHCRTRKFLWRRRKQFTYHSSGSPKKDETDFDTADCILRHKSVFKCRLCPRIVCLSEETLKAHLISKKHIRSEKLLREGRLKLMLNERGEIEGEVHYENNAPTTASGQKPDKPNKKGKGRLKQKKRPRQDTESRKAKPSTEKREKRRKN